MNNFDFDLFVIGGGSGGVRAARMAAMRVKPDGTKVRVGLAETLGTAGLGGTCVNVGCIPKKLYSYAAHYAESFEQSHGFGWDGPAPTFNWETLKNNRRKEISRLNGIYQNVLSGAGVQVFNAFARFIDAHTLDVGGTRITAQHILVATGGQPSVPEFPGREHVLTSNDMFDLAPFPKRLLVVGGGYIACEFASIFNGLGSQVTQLYRGNQVLRGFDADVQRFLAQEVVKAGVDLRLRADVASIVKTASGLVVTLKENADGGSGAIANVPVTIEVDAVLYATGRVPNTQGLGLDAVSVVQRADGAVVVDAHYQTNVPSIYAVGDVTARVQLTPVALGEAMVVVDDLFGPQAGKPQRSMAYTFIPTAVFTHPNIGTVGYSEHEAREKFGEVTIFKTDFKPLVHTLSGSSERTFMKLIVQTATDRVVGLHMVGAEAGEIVQGFAVAMKAGATKATFDSTIGIHPTAAEEFVTMRDASVV